jgi:alpha-glucan,water dikinase
MSVLLQELIPAQYSFVLHTSDPITGAPGCVHGELVLGMGEALVGNFPGRALSFAQNDASIDITTYPSKTHALYCDREDTGGMMLLMARSDSNGEDLQEFAGAGLYSSVPIPITGYTSKSVSYADEQIIWNDEYRQSVIESLISIAQDIEAACGSPQDIEGVIDQAGRVHIVQTRPQIIHHHE